MGKIIDMIAEHKQRITSSCAVMKGRSVEMISELEALRNCAEGKECGASDPKSQEASEDKSASDAADKLSAGAASGAAAAASGAAAPASAAATGQATGAAQSSSSTGSSAESVFDESSPEQVKEN